MVAPEVPRRCPCALRCGLRFGNLRRYLHLEASNRGWECRGNGFVAATELERQRGRRRGSSAARASSRTFILPHSIAFSGRNSQYRGVINSSILRLSARKLFRLVGDSLAGGSSSWKTLPDWVRSAGRLRSAGLVLLEGSIQLRDCSSRAYVVHGRSTQPSCKQQANIW